MLDAAQINDPLYPSAVRMVIETQRASISMLQRRLTIGYNRGAWLIERMELDGVVSPARADGTREVLHKESPMPNTEQEYKDQKGNPLRIGDPVSFVTMSIKGSGYRISAKEGKVETFKVCSNETYAVVKLRNGRTKDVPVGKVRRSDISHNELTEAVMGMANRG